MTSEVQSVVGAIHELPLPMCTRACFQTVRSPPTPLKKGGGNLFKVPQEARGI